MNIKVTLRDNSEISPSYDPEHKQSVLDFYWDMLQAKEILAFEIR